jgi:hypothetical protein
MGNCCSDGTVDQRGDIVTPNAGGKGRDNYTMN